MLYCETYSVYIQNSAKQKAEEQQLAGCVNTWEKWQRLTNCVTLSVQNGSSMRVILHWTVQLRSSVTTYVLSGCMCLIWLTQWEKKVPTSKLCCKVSTYSVTQQRISRTWVFGEQCSGDEEGYSYHNKIMKWRYYSYNWG